MKKIFTLTGNLLAETTLRLADIPARGQTLRAVSETFRTGGKGVNTAKACARLGAKAAMLIFPAGNTGRRCVDYLKKEAFAEILEVPVRGQTREGFVMRTKDGAETTVLGADRPLGLAEFLSGLKKISPKAKRGDILALCGSVPGWTDAFGRAVVRLAKDAGLKLAIDTYGAPLKFFAKAKDTWLVKINLREFAALCGESEAEITSPKEFFKARSKAVSAENFVVTNGAKAVLARIGGVFFAFAPPKIKEVSATGSGDVFTAALLCNLDCAKPQSALKAAAYAASMSAASEEIANFSKSQIKILKSILSE